MQETSEKKRKQIAREDEDLMTIATSPTDLKQDKELRKIYNWEENLKNVFYGEGRDNGRKDRNLEIAKNMLEESDVSYISKVTGLSIEEIEQLKEK